MASFFFQIRLRDEDCELTSVTTPYGLYEFRERTTVLPSRSGVYTTD